MPLRQLALAEQRGQAYEPQRPVGERVSGEHCVTALLLPPQPNPILGQFRLQHEVPEEGRDLLNGAANPLVASAITLP